MLTYPYYTRVHICRICVKITSQPSGEWKCSNCLDHGTKLQKIDTSKDR